MIYIICMTMTSYDHDHKVKIFSIKYFDVSGNVLFSYIGIDIFGSKFCSNLRCSSQDNVKCLQMMNMTYKVTLFPA